MKNTKTLRRVKRTRAKIQGSAKRPRLSVSRSNRYMQAQLIDDTAHKTLIGVSEKHMTQVKGKTKTEKAKEMGKLIAQKAAEQKIKEVIFDRGGFAYHGRVKALAEGAREGGLQF